MTLRVFVVFLPVVATMVVALLVSNVSTKRSSTPDAGISNSDAGAIWLTSRALTFEPPSQTRITIYVGDNYNRPLNGLINTDAGTLTIWGKCSLFDGGTRCTP